MASLPPRFEWGRAVTSEVLADTHAIVWFLFDPARLSPGADQAMTAAAESGTIYISAITLVELIYLSSKRSFPYARVFPGVISLAADPLEPVEAIPLTLEIARIMDRIPRHEVPDMPDRIVAATAVAHNLPLISQDSEIRGSGSLRALVPIIW